MWYKVKELFESGLNTSQIHKETGLDRGTVRKYRLMSEKVFHDWVGIATLIRRYFYAALVDNFINIISISFGVKYPKKECLLSLL